MSSALRDLFIHKFCTEHGSFIEDLGLDVYSEAVTSWEVTEALLASDFDYLLPGWETLDRRELTRVVLSNEEAYERLLSYAEIGNYGNSVRFWGW